MTNTRELLFRVKRRAALAGMRASIRYGIQLPFQSLHDSQNYIFCRSSKSQLPSLPWQFELTDLQQVESTLARGNASSVLSSHPHDAIGDTQTQWTRSRLQKLVTLGLVCQQSKDDVTRQAAAGAMVLSLGEWLAANPWLRGVNYRSTMECALRLICCCHAFDMARQYLHESDDWQDLLYLVHSHAYFIERRLCLYSFTGNHTIGECAGLVYAGVIFPEMPGAQRWLATGLKHMSAEVNKQILTDGGNCEKSFQYLLLITDLCGLVTVLLDHHDKPNSEIKKAWRRGCAFLQAFSDCPRGLPTIGDSDDAYALSEFLRLSWQNSDFSPCVTDGRIKQFPASGLSIIKGDQALHGDMLFSHSHLGIAKVFWSWAC